MCVLALDEAEYGDRYGREEKFQLVVGHLSMMLRCKREAGLLDTFQGGHEEEEEEESNMDEGN